MKIRLIQPGFERYNGQMGVHFFEEGLSVADVRDQDAVRMSAVMLCEWEDGSSANVAQSILDNANTAAPVYSTKGDGSDHDAAADRVAQRAAVVESAVSADKPRTSTFSAEQLEAIADKSGIKGLREIADPLGLKGTSIKELIDSILKRGAEKAPE